MGPGYYKAVRNGAVLGIAGGYVAAMVLDRAVFRRIFARADTRTPGAHLAPTVAITPRATTVGIGGQF